MDILNFIFNRSTGFVLEGFPRTSEETKYMAEMGLFPDTAIILNVEDSDVIGRLLPPKLDKWRVKRDKRLEKKRKKKEKAQKKRVRINKYHKVQL
jgi:adenylate/nucleoside-diphosphate kinase